MKQKSPLSKFALKKGNQSYHPSSTAIKIRQSHRNEKVFLTSDAIILAERKEEEAVERRGERDKKQSFACPRPSLPACNPLHLKQRFLPSDKQKTKCEKRSYFNEVARIAARCFKNRSHA